MTSFNDTRVLYVEPAKWVQALRETTTGDEPIVMKIEMDGGHGGASGRYEGWKTGPGTTRSWPTHSAPPNSADPDSDQPPRRVSLTSPRPWVLPNEHSVNKVRGTTWQQPERAPLIPCWRTTTASEWMGIEVLRLDDGHATIRMTLRQEMMNGFGMAHGGMIFAFADTAFALACNPAERRRRAPSPWPPAST